MSRSFRDIRNKTKSVTHKQLYTRLHTVQFLDLHHYLIPSNKKGVHVPCPPREELPLSKIRGWRIPSSRYTEITRENSTRDVGVVKMGRQFMSKSRSHSRFSHTRIGRRVNLELVRTHILISKNNLLLLLYIDNNVLKRDSEMRHDFTYNILRTKP